MIPVLSWHFMHAVYLRGWWGYLHGRIQSNVPQRGLCLFGFTNHARRTPMYQTLPARPKLHTSTPRLRDSFHCPYSHFLRPFQWLMILQSIHSAIHIPLQHSRSIEEYLNHPSSSQQFPVLALYTLGDCLCKDWMLRRWRGKRCWDRLIDCRTVTFYASLMMAFWHEFTFGYLSI